MRQDKLSKKNSVFSHDYVKSLKNGKLKVHGYRKETIYSSNVIGDNHSCQH